MLRLEYSSQCAGARQHKRVGAYLLGIGVLKRLGAEQLLHAPAGWVHTMSKACKWVWSPVREGHYFFTKCRLLTMSTSMEVVVVMCSLLSYAGGGGQKVQRGSD